MVNAETAVRPAPHGAALSARPPGVARRSNALQRRSARTGWLLSTPALLMVLVFFVIPLLLMVWMSLNEWPLVGTEHFVGMQNYGEMLGDATFWSSLGFTALYTVIVTPLHVAIGYGLALVVRRKVRGVGALRTAYFLPVVVGFATAAYVFLVLLQPDSQILRLLGLSGLMTNWQTNPTLAVTVVVVLVSWKTAGTAMILYLAGMQAIPEEVLEAAQMDGATWWQREIQVVAPLVARTTALVLILGVAGSFLAFEQFFILTHGGPSNATLTTVMWIYTSSFIHYRLGYGATLSVALLVIVMLLSLVQLVLLREREDQR